MPRPHRTMSRALGQMAEPLLPLRATPCAEELAALHSASFPSHERWTKEDFESFLRQKIVKLCAVGAPQLQGFILWREIAGEAEILTLAVHPKTRRQGIAHHLLKSATEEMRKADISCLHLEVKENNIAALRLYTQFGFEITGRRVGYYKAPPHQKNSEEPDTEDALIMRLETSENHKKHLTNSS